MSLITSTRSIFVYGRLIDYCFPSLLLPTSINQFHKRFIGKSSKVIYPWMNRRKPYWVDQEADPRSDEDLTQENKAFLEAERMRLLAERKSPLIAEQWTQSSWIPNVTQRCGLIGIKLGMYPLWTKEGKKLDCTIIQIPDNHALRYVPPAKIDDYLSLRDPRGYWFNDKQVPSWITQRRWGLQLVGAVSADPLEFTPAWCGLFNEAGVPPKRKISRFLVSPDAALKPGNLIQAVSFTLMMIRCRFISRSLLIAFAFCDLEYLISGILFLLPPGNNLSS
ncbi:unnamed protein product [Dicrocoelium dendriticum]|nr:unnamed protein product [Dicrocoelium dendriticum]